jgi:hypothetical protein
MAKMYTLDEKFLVGVPEIRIKDQVFPVDDRKNTVSKILKIAEDNSLNEEEKINETFKLSFGKKYNAVAKLVDGLSWSAYQELFTLVILAVTGQDQEDDDSKSKGEGSGS